MICGPEMISIGGSCLLCARFRKNILIKAAGCSLKPGLIGLCLQLFNLQLFNGESFSFAI
jgi:hypothetical protein